MIVARLLIGGGMLTSTALLAATAVETTPEGVIDKLTSARPELAAVLMCVSMFLAFIYRQDNRQKAIVDKITDDSQKARDHMAEQASKLLTAAAEKDVRDREERHASRNDCHSISLKMAVIAEKCSDALERCAEKSQ